jgi:hypothetical protein
MFSITSVVPSTTDLSSPSIWVYASLAPLRPLADELATVTASVVFVVLIWSLHLLVIWSSSEDLSIT